MAPLRLSVPHLAASRFAALVSARCILTVLLLFTMIAKRGDSVLDLCCGSGYLMFLMSEKVGAYGKEWMIDNVVVPTATVYGLAKENRYLKTSINEFLTGKELEKLALDAGFSFARPYEIGGGLIGNLVATR